jgi:cobalt-zinc-cadmium efflux system outer membrane protein
MTHQQQLSSIGGGGAVLAWGGIPRLSDLAIPPRRDQVGKRGRVRALQTGTQAAACMFAIILVLTGCAHFHPEPLSPEKNAAALEARSLTNSALKTFLETNLHRDFNAWPQAAWDFDMLTLAAFYYHPDLEVARAQWHIAEAGIKTAGGRPNPTLSLVPGYDTTHNPGLSPWFPAISFDLPLETVGKRGHRIAVARHASESAHFNVLTVAWQVRSGLRSALLDTAAAGRREELLRQQVSIEEEIVSLLEQRVKAGEIATIDSRPAWMAQQKARLDLADAVRQATDARSRLAAALGLSAAALDIPALAFDPLAVSVANTNLTSAQARRTALLSRSDILGALADYAETESVLQSEIAKQYPDVHVNPGYQFDQGDNKWSIGITFDLPILNQNQGPIAEAKTRREEAAAKFNALQAKVLAEIDRALASWRASESDAGNLQSLAEAQEYQRASAEAQFNAGAIDRLDLLTALSDSVTARLSHLDAVVRLRQAEGQLEDALQQPARAVAGIAWQPPRGQSNKL